jgi:hypothetical protein
VGNDLLDVRVTPSTTHKRRWPMIGMPPTIPREPPILIGNAELLVVVVCVVVVLVSGLEAVVGAGAGAGAGAGLAAGAGAGAGAGGALAAARRVPGLMGPPPTPSALSKSVTPADVRQGQQVCCWQHTKAVLDRAAVDPSCFHPSHTSYCLLSKELNRCKQTVLHSGCSQLPICNQYHVADTTTYPTLGCWPSHKSQLLLPPAFKVAPLMV